MNEKVSICAVTCRNILDTIEFINSVLINTPDPYELIIIDNDSPTEVKSFLEQVSQLSNVTVVFNEKNIGIGYAMNQAMHLATTDYIFRCDTDILVPNNWTIDMLEWLKCTDNVGAVSTALTKGAQVQNENYMETSFMNSHCMLIPRTAMNKMKEKFDTVKDRVIKQCREDLSQGAGYPKQHEHLNNVIKYMEEEVGYWDPGYFYGADDFDYSLALRWSGLKLIVARNVISFHREASMDEQWKKIRHDMVSEGFQYYRTKWERLFDFYGIPGQGWTDVWPCLPINQLYMNNWRQLDIKEDRKNFVRRLISEKCKRDI